MKSSDKKTKRSSGLDMSSPPQPPSLSPATLSLIGPLKHPLFRPGKSYDYKNRKMIGNYMLGSTIGAGSMGKVKVAVRMDTKEKFAVKIIPRILPPNVPRMTKQEQESAEKRIVREASILFLCDHPHVVKLHEVIVSPSNYYLFFEYVDGGQMLDYIVTNGRLRERHARRFVRQLVSALEYIHSNSIVHRDLKIENILLTSSSTIKLIDFGLSNTFSPSSHLTTFCGSLYFASPELLNAKPYIGPEVDIWSLGVITYVLVCGKVPFDDPNMPNLHLKIKKGEVEYPGFLSDELRQFLSRMLTVEPSLRASLSELKSHPWLNKNYSSPPRSFLPPRNAISLQEGFDKEIIKNMEGFGFGDVDEIEEKLWAILRDRPHGHRNEFSKGVAKCNGKDASLPPHPILSIYVLVKEKMESEGYVSPVHSQFSSSTSLPGTSGHNSHGQNDNGNKENEDNDLRRLEILKKGGMADSGTSIDFVASSASSSDEGEDSSMADVDKTPFRSSCCLS
ncbi:kinase-like domain-containing protein [Paraphysoderma sedebokerense]|nr:kinase-like domain-containing protein [Paraphysoderma sedebokerense]